MFDDKPRTVYIATASMCYPGDLLEDVLQATGGEDLIVGTYEGDPAVLFPNSSDTDAIVYELCGYGYDVYIVTCDRCLILLDEDNDTAEYIGRIRNTTDPLPDLVFPHGNFKIVR